MTEEFGVLVSIVVPTYNEEANIAECLQSLVDSENPEGNKEILVVDGQSQDDTRDIVQKFAKKWESITLCDNPDRTTPEAMNIGIENASGDVIVFVSGHSTVSDDFFEKILDAFENAPEADVVGGRMLPEPETYFETGVAGALVSPIGSSSTRFQAIEGYVETVNFGAYRKEVLDTVGYMDSDLPRGQDYEYNRRVRANDFKIYQYPDLVVRYFPRSSPADLARQYFGNGYWKTNVYRKYGDYPFQPRICAIGAILLGFILLPILLFVILPLYLVILSAVTLKTIHSQTVKNLEFVHFPAVVFSLVILHISFCAGILYGSLFPPGERG